MATRLNTITATGNPSMPFTFMTETYISEDEAKMIVEAIREYNDPKLNVFLTMKLGDVITPHLGKD